MTGDTIGGSRKLSFKLEGFEGPLDLLLLLISKNKINIYDIPIALLLEQYLCKLDEMKSMDLDVTSEFLAMAAHLVYIKSQMLLPRHEEEDEEDPRERLVRMLIEYKRYKGVVLHLAERARIGENRYVKKPDRVEPDESYRLTHSPQELKDAYLMTVKRIKRRLPPPASSFQGIVGRVVVSVSGKVVELLRRLVSRRSIGYQSAFSRARSRSDVVAIFLAILELTKIRRIRFTELGGGDYLLKLEEKRKEVLANGSDGA